MNIAIITVAPIRYKHKRLIHLVFVFVGVGKDAQNPSCITASPTVNRSGIGAGALERSIITGAEVVMVRTEAASTCRTTISVAAASEDMMSV